MGRKCAVPYCYTGYRKCKDKVSLFRVPQDDLFLTAWNDVVAREDRPINLNDYVCAKHFKESDIMRQRMVKDTLEVYQRPRLKPDAVPSVFPDLPECIPKMVRKCRKMIWPEKVDKPVEADDNKEKEEVTIKVEPADFNEPTDDLFDSEIQIKSEECFDEDEESKLEICYDSDGTKMHKCSQCDYKTKFYHNLSTHASKHMNLEDAYRCEMCPKFVSKWKLSYDNHMKIKHGVGNPQTFACQLCPYVTKVKLCLKRHMERHNDPHAKKNSKKMSE